MINVLIFQVLLATLSVYQMLWPVSNNNTFIAYSNDFLKQVLANSWQKSFLEVFSNACIECMLHNAVYIQARVVFWREVLYIFGQFNMGRKRGTECCAFGCSKRRKLGDTHSCRSNSEGSSDEESLQKRKFQRTFH